MCLCKCLCGSTSMHVCLWMQCKAAPEHACSQRCMDLCCWVIFGNMGKHACGHVGICGLRGGVGAAKQPKEQVAGRRGGWAEQRRVQPRKESLIAEAHLMGYPLPDHVP